MIEQQGFLTRVNVKNKKQRKMIDELKKELLKEENNVNITENGAVMYKTTGKSLLDLYWKSPSMRAIKPDDLKKDNLDGELFKAYNENRELFLKFLFYLRDIRGGMGERNSFRNYYLWLLSTDPKNAVNLLPLVPEYGRWDDLVWILCNYCFEDADYIRFSIAKLIGKQLQKDIENYPNNLSLLGKWLPSINAGKESKSEAKKLIFWLNNAGYPMHEAEYRKVLSKLRKGLKIVETDVAAKTYGNINYEAVPSVANTYYSNLFLKYDTERRRKFLEALANGEKKINASAVFPHDIYKNVSYYSNEVNATYEEMWKALPNFVNSDSKTLVVRDGSGSMETNIPNSNTTALNVASALCVYFSEKLTGEFKDKFITFSSHPELVDLSKCKSLYEKKKMLRNFNDCSNTDIEKTFMLVLDTAVNNNMKQEDLPDQLLIVSDMEFDGATTRSYYGNSQNLFSTINKRFNEKGYKMPKLVFWNVNSRTNSFPLTQNENGVILVSGYSVSNCKMVLGGELDPFKALCEQLMNKRYEPIRYI